MENLGFMVILSFGFIFINIFCFLASPNLNIHGFLEKADKVNALSISERFYKLSSLLYIRRLSTIALCIIIIILSFRIDGGQGVSAFFIVTLSIYIVHSLIRIIIHYPCTFIKFDGDTVYYCNGKRTTTFSIDNIESILFQKYNKRKGYRKWYGNFMVIRYQYMILCFRTLVLDCQRLTLENEFNYFFSSLKSTERYDFQLEFDIFNFEYSHEVFALLSQKAYVPIH